MRAIRLAVCAALFTGMLGLTAGAAQKDDAPRLKFEVYKDKGGDFRWRLKAGNGAVLATGGQGYKSKADAKHGAEAVQKAGAAGSKAAFEVYDDAKKETRWRLKASNGQVIAASSQGYKAKADAEKAVAEIKAGAAKAEVVEVKD